MTIHKPSPYKKPPIVEAVIALHFSVPLALLIHRNYRNERRMWRKAAIRFMILVARPIRGSIEERHTHHGRRYSPAVRSSIGCMQEIERWFRRRAALVGCGRASAARRREEARACRAPFVVHPGPAQARAHRAPA